MMRPARPPTAAQVFVNTEGSRPAKDNDGLGTIWVDRFSSCSSECRECKEHETEPWYAAVYWTQLPAFASQGTRPIRYGRGEFGATRDEAVAKLRAVMGLVCP